MSPCRCDDRAVFRFTVLLLGIGLLGILVDVLFSLHLTPLSGRMVSAVGSTAPLLLLVSYDGFRWDYLNKSSRLYAFDFLAKRGVRASQGLLNTYVTVTAPNHYGIVTGLYEESHGIIDNRFYDAKLNKWFDYFKEPSKTDPAFFGGRPLWLLNQDAGPGRYSGCVMWVGCDMAIGGRYPTYYVPMDKYTLWELRVEKLISWFKDPVRPVNFALFYIEEPDATGHRVGPDDPAVVKMIEKLDGLTSYLLYRLDQEDLLDRMNIIFTSDHGMTNVPEENAIHVDSIVDSSLYTLMSNNEMPNWNVLPNPGKEEEVYKALLNKHPHMKVHKRASIPDEYHYKDNDRVMPLHLEADLHWILVRNESNAKSSRRNGEHGYNNSLSDMQPYFIGVGPAFKSGVEVDSFENVDIYPLICHILGLQPDSNNGSLARVRQVLKNEGRGEEVFSASFLFDRLDGCVKFLLHSFSCVGFNRFVLMLLFGFFSLFFVALAAAEMKLRLIEKGMFAKEGCRKMP